MIMIGGDYDDNHDDDDDDDDHYDDGFGNGGDCEEGWMEIRKRRTKFFQLFALVFCTVWITDRETEKSGAEQEES